MATSLATFIPHLDNGARGEIMCTDISQTDKPVRERDTRIPGNMTEQARNRKNKQTAIFLMALALGMFGLGFALSPVYRLICEAIGIQVSTTAFDISKPADSTSSAPTYNREITITFDATVNNSLPWEFKPVTRKLLVRPGETTETKYVVRNLSSRVITGQAIPSLAPASANQYFQKIECFCFSQQTVAAGELREMPLRFVVSPNLPDFYDQLTLSYTFVNVKEQAGITSQPLASPSAEGAGQQAVAM